MQSYQNYYPTSYPTIGQQQYQPQYTQYQMPQVQQPQSNNGIVWVQGEAGAKSYLVAAGQSVLLMDSESSSFYIKSTDPSGMPLPLRIFDYTERTAMQNVQSVPQQAETISMQNFVTRKEFEEVIAQLMAQDKNLSNPKEDTGNG